jgi:flagellar capping protein FliD
MKLQDIFDIFWQFATVILLPLASYLYSQFRMMQTQVRTLENSLYRLENRVDSQNALVLEKLTNIEKFFKLKFDRLEEKITDLNEKVKNEN